VNRKFFIDSDRILFVKGLPYHFSFRQFYAFIQPVHYVFEAVIRHGIAEIFKVFEIPVPENEQLVRAWMRVVVLSVDIGLEICRATLNDC
jgi:hypothetical protein